MHRTLGMHEFTRGGLQALRVGRHAGLRARNIPSSALFGLLQVPDAVAVLGKPR
jgi:hypothetical protein